MNPRSVRLYAAALVAVLSMVSPSAVHTSDARQTTAAIDVAKIHIDNFGRINPTYYRGAQPEGRDYADLAAFGVRTVINLTSDDAVTGEQALVEAARMKYLQIPMTTHEAPTPEKLSAFLRAVNDPAGQPVYVHCVGGRHRTGVMTAVYRMTHDGWTAEQAFKEMKKYKFGFDFLHPEFKQFVYGYRVDLAHPSPAQAVRAGS